MYRPLKEVRLREDARIDIAGRWHAVLASSPSVSLYFEPEYQVVIVEQRGKDPLLIPCANVVAMTPQLDDAPPPPTNILEVSVEDAAVMAAAHQPRRPKKK